MRGRAFQKFDVKLIAFSFSYADGKDSPPSPLNKYEFPSIGDHGEEYEFTFLYRSKSQSLVAPLRDIVLIGTELLQNIGCIPRTPSPQPDPHGSRPRESKSETHDLPPKAAREIEILRVGLLNGKRLADLHSTDIHVGGKRGAP